MGWWPFTRLHYGRGCCAAIAGPHIRVFDVASGQVRAKTRCASIISHSVVDENYVYIVTAGEDKKLDVWDLDGLRLRSSRELPKKATAVQLSRDGQTIIVADKFGDVFNYPLDPPSPPPLSASASSAPEPRAKELQASHENPHGTLVLGHASIITSLCLSHDGRHVITADRDEHIRVSRYPQGYVIERYCLGHRTFVSALCVPSFEPSSLVSGGGDPSLNVWDWMSGTLICQIPVADTVKPFLKVRESRQKWHAGEGDPSGPGSRRGRKGRRRGRKANVTPGDVEMEEEPNPSGPSPIATSAPAPEEDPVFAVAKVEGFNFSGEKLLVFTAIGGSALFYCAYPKQASDTLTVRHVDLTKPILDFVLGDDFQVLVSIDAAWSPGGTQDQSEAAMKLVAWKDGEFHIVEGTSPLLTSMCGVGLQEASAAELVTLGLYANLALLPKHAEEFEEGNDAGDDSSDMRSETPQGVKRASKRQHAKAIGRLKTQQALLKKSGLDVTRSQSVSGDEHEGKKIKLDD